MASKKGLSAYIVFPITYLVLELIEETLIYKAEGMDLSLYVLTATVLAILVFVISVVAFVLVPFLQGGLEALKKSDKKLGPLGAFCLSIFIIAFIYSLYYVKLKGGSIEALLPFEWRNK